MTLAFQLTNRASFFRNNTKILLEKRFKVCFLLFSLWFMTNFVSTSSQFRDEFGFDYKLYKNQKITVVNELRTVTLAKIDCRERYLGRLLVLADDNQKRAVVSNFLRSLEYSKYRKIKIWPRINVSLYLIRSNSGGLKPLFFTKTHLSPPLNRKVA